MFGKILRFREENRRARYYKKTSMLSIRAGVTINSRGSWVQTRRSSVVGAKSWVVGAKSWGAGEKSVVPLVL